MPPWSGSAGKHPLEPVTHCKPYQQESHLPKYLLPCHLFSFLNVPDYSIRTAPERNPARFALWSLPAFGGPAADSSESCKNPGTNDFESSRSQCIYIDFPMYIHVYIHLPQPKAALSGGYFSSQRFAPAPYSRVACPEELEGRDLYGVVIRPSMNSGQVALQSPNTNLCPPDAV